jgi:glucose/arabinose dehydrogenase
MKNLSIVTGIVGCSLALSLSGEAARATSLGIDPSLQSQFNITPFATGLDFPNGIAQLSDGSLLVGTSTGNGYFDPQAKGQLVRFQDTNGDGISDSRTVLYDGTIAGNSLPGGITAIRSIDKYLFVNSSVSGSYRISVFEQGVNFNTNSLTLKGSLDFAYPNGFVHPASALAVRQTAPQQYELFFNIGAAGNNQATAPGTVSLSSSNFGVAATLNGDALYKLPITIGTTNLTIANPVQVASGLRNAAALAFEPTTGALYIGENGIDGLTNANNALTPDELNRLTTAELASVNIENFGFPNYSEQYGNPGTYIDGNGQIVSKTDPNWIDPLVTFQPLTTPAPTSESEGIASIAFAPTNFPVGTNNGAFLGFFGRFAFQPTDDRENPLVYYDLTTGRYFHFLSSKYPGGEDFGRLTNLLSTPDSLFAVDIGTGSGSLFSSAGLGRGAIYQISAASSLPAQSVPEPSTLLGTLVTLGGGIWLKRKAKQSGAKLGRN